MDTVRYGVIGLGFFGEKHCEMLQAMPGVDLAAVCTRRPERVAEVAEAYGAAKTYTDYTELLADDEIDAVSVVTHITDHRDIAIAALEAGRHVFLEKPMAPDEEDCAAIVAAAEKAAGKFMVGHICRFDPRVALAKQAIDGGRIGRIVSMHATRNLPARITAAGVLDKVSPLMGDGIHDTDLMLWFNSSPVISVYAQNIRVRDFEYPDIGWAMYRFANKAVGVIETVWCLPDNTPFAIDARMEIIGTEGALYIDAGNAGLTIQDRDGIRKPDTVYWPGLEGQTAGVLRNELTYFTDCIRGDRVPDMITPAESAAAVAVVAAAERSAVANAVITL